MAKHSQASCRRLHPLWVETVSLGARDVAVWHVTHTTSHLLSAQPGTQTEAFSLTSLLSSGLAQPQALGVCRRRSLSCHPPLHLRLAPSIHLFPSELGVVGSMQDLESQDLNWTHEPISFRVNLDALFESQ